MIYANLSGKSSARSYEVGPDFIDVTFKDGHTYRYSYASAGPVAVEAMKVLAESGSGLVSYIHAHAKTAYESKR